jgi:hypothetical protein
MSSERTDEVTEAPVSESLQSSDGGRDNAGRDGASARGHGPSSDGPSGDGPSGDNSRREAIVVVRGENVSDQGTKSSPKESSPKESSAKEKEKAPRKELSEAKVKMQSRLPVLDDDGDVGVQKEQVVVRDGKADLAFSGALLASAAPPSAPQGQWQEYRIYETGGGKHVFSKVGRSVAAAEQDTHEAEVFDPSPSSVPSQLLRSARDLTRSHPVTWIDAAVAFFGYDPLAKALYRKLSGEFEEHIS